MSLLRFYYLTIDSNVSNLLGCLLAGLILNFELILEYLVGLKMWLVSQFFLYGTMTLVLRLHQNITKMFTDLAEFHK